MEKQIDAKPGARAARKAATALLFFGLVGKLRNFRCNHVDGCSQQFFVVVKVLHGNWRHIEFQASKYSLNVAALEWF